MTIQELQTRIDHLDRDEKIHVLHKLAMDLTHTWPGIEKNANVQGGDACVIRTRIPVWTLEAYRRIGWDDAKLRAEFPTLRSADLVYASLYVEANPEEIEQTLREQAEA